MTTGQPHDSTGSILRAKPMWTGATSPYWYSSVRNQSLHGTRGCLVVPFLRGGRYD